MRQTFDARTRRAGNTLQAWLLGSVLAMSLTAFASPSHAARTEHKPTSHAVIPARGPTHHVTLRRAADNTPTRNLHHAVFFRRVADNTPTTRHGTASKLTKNSKTRIYASRYAGTRLQCVTFARAASGIELKGNAVNWWDAAAGVYARGNEPEAGAVLNFRANGRMRLGHVAVVERIVNSREIEIDQANWAWSGKSNISRDVSVIDVSERNDWTAVRVSLGRGEEYGSVYGTYGFIYDRPDNGVMVANTPRHLGAPARDVRDFDEVAEAPRAAAITDDAPPRSVR